MAIDFEKKRHVAKVGLNNPKNLNAITTDLCMELCDVWDTCQNDPDIRVVVVYSALEKIFCSGMDINDTIPLLTCERSPSNDKEKYLFDPSTEFAGFSKALLKRRTLYKPVIAAINGRCFTAGFELSQACDLRMGTADSTYMAKESQLGLLPMSGGNIFLPTLIGSGRALEMNLTGDPYPASTMLNWGFLNRVAPDKSILLRDAQDFAEKLASNGPMALQRMVELNRAQRGLTLNDALSKEVELALPVYKSDAPKEGFKAMQEKRKPKFKSY